MEGTPKVQLLSTTKQRRSLGNSKKREKASKKPTRTAVVSPNDIEWPDVKAEVAEEILECVQRSLKCLNVPRHCPLKEISGVPKEKRAAFRRQWIAKQALQVGFDMSSFTLKRSELSIGVNCCSANMEIGQLVGLVIEKDVDPQIITKLLVPIARSKDVPIISLVGLKAAVKNACGVRCIALGFKRACESESSPFYELQKLVKKYYPVEEKFLSHEAATMKAYYLQMVQQHLRKSPELESSNNPPVGDNLGTNKEEDVGAAAATTSTKPVTAVETATESRNPTSFSIEDELRKLEMKEAMKKRGGSLPHATLEVNYIPPKIRKVVPE